MSATEAEALWRALTGGNTQALVELMRANPGNLRRPVCDDCQGTGIRERAEDSAPVLCVMCGPRDYFSDAAIDVRQRAFEDSEDR